MSDLHEARDPQKATVRQTLDIVMESLGTHPADRHAAASLIALGALTEAFPCKRR